MIREIIIPTESQYILQLPESLIGKKVEVLAFELEELVDNSIIKELTFNERLKDFSFNSGGYQFDRNEANSYE